MWMAARIPTCIVSTAALRRLSKNVYFEPGSIEALPPRVELTACWRVGRGGEVVGSVDRRVDVVAADVGDDHQIARLREHLRCPEHLALDRAREARVARDDDSRERTGLAT